MNQSPEFPPNEEINGADLFKKVLNSLYKLFDEALTIIFYSMIVGAGLTAGAACVIAIGLK